MSRCRSLSKEARSFGDGGHGWFLLTSSRVRIVRPKPVRNRHASVRRAQAPGRRSLWRVPNARDNSPPQSGAKPRRPGRVSSTADSLGATARTSQPHNPKPQPECFGHRGCVGRFGGKSSAHQACSPPAQDGTAVREMRPTNLFRCSWSNSALLLMQTHNGDFNREPRRIENPNPR